MLQCKTVIKSFTVGSDPVYHSIVRREYKGQNISVMTTWLMNWWSLNFHILKKTKLHFNETFTFYIK